MTLLLLFLLLGVGLGSAAAAWATRRPEFVVRVEDGFLWVSGEPSQKDFERLRATLERAWGVYLSQPVEAGVRVPIPEGSQSVSDPLWQRPED